MANQSLPYSLCAPPFATLEGVLYMVYLVLGNSSRNDNTHNYLCWAYSEDGISWMDQTYILWGDNNPIYIDSGTVPSVYASGGNLVVVYVSSGELNYVTWSGKSWSTPAVLQMAES